MNGARQSGVGLDIDRAAMYAAEQAAFDGTDLEDVRELGAAIALVRAVVEGAWWPGPVVRARAARRDSRSSSCRPLPVTSSGTPVGLEIRLAAEQATPATVAHELGHALAGPHHGHDPTFRRAMLDVVAVMTNIDPTDRRHRLHSDQLATALRAAGLAVGDRRWPAPPSSIVGPIAL